ncbi:MAG TPA: PH domain-containing protein [Candidatus Limnocylindrales bacterium]|nr:PH domain-containing protein [Candidatus Limnocylindrales bacterium]
MSEIDEGLLANERVILRTNKHWFAPVADSGWPVLMLLAVVVLAWLQPAQREGLFSFVWRLVDLIQLGLFLGAIGWIVYNVVAWRTAEYGVTTLRVRGHEGLLKKRNTDSLLSSITDVQSKSSVLGRTLGFGNIRIMTASGDAGQDNFTSMKGVDAFKKTILEQKAGAARPASPAATAAPAAPSPEPAQVATASAPAPDPMATIIELAKLRDAGAITPAEFEAKKAELLARI